MRTRFSWQRLAKVLERFPAAARYWVAFSGGLDSHVLLHALVDLRNRGVLPELGAAHINHGLHAEANDWEWHCAEVCRALGVPFRSLRVQAKPETGESPEAAAREARYHALSSVLDPGDFLLTAHHRDDQAETVLLQLVRGAGPAGLAAMPAYAPFGKGWLGRPLLEMSRETLERYGSAKKLQWLSDSSNADIRYDRNFIRHQALPTLLRRWPSISRILSRVALNQLDAVCILDDVALTDLAAISGPTRNILSRRALLTLSPARQRNVLRYWLRCLDLPLPNRTHIEAIRADAVGGSSEGSPCIRWGGAEVRRYRDGIYAMCSQSVRPALRLPQTWDLRAPLALPEGWLSATVVYGAGIGTGLAEGRLLDVRFRMGGERCRPAGQRHTRQLKKLFQERGVAPWQRSTLPLVYIDGELAAVADLWVCERFAARPGEPGWLLSWQPAHRALTRQQAPPYQLFDATMPTG